MKLRIEIDPDGPEEVVIKAKAITESLQNLQTKLERTLNASGEIALKKGNEEFYLPYREILYFEIEGKSVTAYTKDEAFQTALHLNELSLLLPKSFTRASKSCIVNTAKICSIVRSPTGVSVARFSGSDSILYISRKYYHVVREIIEETRLN